jgi:hypothetical protein
MMLFHIRAPVNRFHWTEIYLIITVSAALLEDIRKVERHCQNMDIQFTFIAIFRTVLIFIRK